MSTTQEPQHVTVTDFKMPFGSMVVLMVKWAIAAIPAFLILFVLGTVLSMMVAGTLISMATGLGGTTARDAKPTAVVATAAPGQPAPVPAEVEYLSLVAVSGVEVGDARSGKAVFGQVKNLGERSLSTVEITVYCLDKAGKAIFEKTYTPVLVTTLAFGDNQPLKPSYSRKFGLTLDDAPSEWAGKVNVRTTRVEFQK